MEIEIKGLRSGLFRTADSQAFLSALFQRPLSSAPFPATQDFGVAGRPYRLDHFEDALANAALADLVVSAHQFERLALDQRVLFLFERRAGLAEALAAAA